MIEFRLDRSSGLTTYGQLVQQVRQAVRLGRLATGDQLPTVKEVVSKLAINPNTVLKAYRELEIAGFVHSRQGQGTFISAAGDALPHSGQLALERSFARWLRSAHEAGFDMESIRAIVDVGLQETDLGTGVA